MKTTRILSLAMTMAMGMIPSLQASVTEHQPPAPLPEFKTPEQLSKWRTETKAKTSAQEASRLSTLDSSTPFYTGKPYLADSGSYAFKYREYNPEMGRWTTVDPSGFPDGANNRVYAAVPTIQLDNNGLDTTTINDNGIILSASYTISYDYYNSPTLTSYTLKSFDINASLGKIGYSLNYSFGTPSLQNNVTLYSNSGAPNSYAVTYSGVINLTVTENYMLGVGAVSTQQTTVAQFSKPYTVTSYE
jgi:RHS repeat-associated protein